MLVTLGGISRTSYHLLPYFGYRNAHAKKHNTNYKIALTPTIEIVTASSQLLNDNKIESIVNTSLLFNVFGFKKEIELTEQKINFFLKDEKGNSTI